MSARKGMNLKQVKNQLELLEGILEQDATTRITSVQNALLLNCFAMNFTKQ